MANAITGLLYKKVMNSDGTMREKVPYLLRTWAGYVFTSDGTAIEDKITSMNTEIDKKASQVILTQEEYDALPDTKLTDDVNYMIKDAESGGGGDANIWQGTKAEYEAEMESIPAGTTILIEGDGSGEGGGIISLTQAEYDALSEEEKVIGSYCITDAEGATTVGELALEVNALNENLTIDGDYKFKVGKDGDGNVCYYGADGSLIPFKSGGELGFVASKPTASVSEINLPSNYTNEKFFSYSDSDGSFTVLKKCNANFVLATGGARVNGYVYLYINDTIKAQILNKLDVITYNTELNVGDKINCCGKTSNGDYGSYPLVSCSV